MTTFILHYFLLLVIGCFAANDFLFYGPSLDNSDYGSTLTANGKTFDVVTGATWASMTKSDFQQYKALVFADPTCRTDPDTVLSSAYSNKAAWSAAVDGNAVVIGTDEHFHWAQGGSQLAKNMLLFAGDIAGKTGLYVSLSCYYHGVTTVPIPLLSEFTSDTNLVAVQTQVMVLPLLTTVRRM